MQCKQQQISANARQFSPPFLLEIHIEVPEETDNYFFGAQIFFFFLVFASLTFGFGFLVIIISLLFLKPSFTPLQQLYNLTVLHRIEIRQL